MARRVKPSSLFRAGRASVSLALDHLDNVLSAECRQDVLAWLGRELKRRHLTLHKAYPNLPPRRSRDRRRRRATA